MILLWVQFKNDDSVECKAKHQPVKYMSDNTMECEEAQEIDADSPETTH